MLSEAVIRDPKGHDKVEKRLHGDKKGGRERFNEGREGVAVHAKKLLKDFGGEKRGRGGQIAVKNLLGIDNSVEEGGGKRV